MESFLFYLWLPGGSAAHLHAIWPSVIPPQTGVFFIAGLVLPVQLFSHAVWNIRYHVGFLTTCLFVIFEVGQHVLKLLFINNFALQLIQSWHIPIIRSCHLHVIQDLSNRLIFDPRALFFGAWPTAHCLESEGSGVNVTDRVSQAAELYGEYTNIAFIVSGANRTGTPQLINWTLISTFQVIISNTRHHVIFHKRGRVFHQGFQLFSSVWKPWWNTKSEVMKWLLKRA